LMVSVGYKNKSEILSKGAPKHAENPILGKFCLAMLTSAAKSSVMVKALVCTLVIKLN